MRTLVLAALGAALFLGACSRSQQLYPGPERSTRELARIECPRYGEELALMAVDGQEYSRSYAMVLPGAHRLTLRGPKNITSEYSPELIQDRHLDRPVVELELEVTAGMTYQLGVTYKDRMGSRARYDGAHSYEEAYYRTWSVDVYAREASSSRLPDLIQSFEFQAGQ
jgi:hypothetical protein